MTAESYIRDHWMRRQTYLHLEWPKHQARLEGCAKRLPDRPGARYIDVGCATGHSTAILKKFRPGFWTGVDFSQTAIAAAWRFYPKGITFFEIPEISALGQMGIFDGVVCSEVLEHVQDDLTLAKMLIWITAPGGRLVATTPTTHVSDPGHLRIYTGKTLRWLFELASQGQALKIEVETAGPFFYLTAEKGATDP